ncbi:unnamed protein product [Jaminaea pallidilutea]
MPAQTLSPRAYALPERVRNDPNEAREAVLCIPFGKHSGLKLPSAARTLLKDVFDTELERGLTYPQELPFSDADFDGTFLGYDLVVGIFLSSLPSGFQHSNDGVDLSIQDALGSSSSDLESLDWKKSLACFYYIKPNYLGRSSHLCNAGFVVPDWNRGLGLGGLAGRSFLHFGPLCGYRGSVFNLVYETNAASLAIWQRLGFTMVGKIPGAGRLKNPNAKEGEDKEQYVDAWVIYCDFMQRQKLEDATKKEVA